MGSNVPILGRTFLPRKGLKRKSRRKAEGFLRNWSGKPGFFGLCPKKCALDRLGKSKCSNLGIYNNCFLSLRDSRAQYRILTRIRRLSIGNPGDVKPVGEGISEMRIDYGPGYRVYYKDTGKEIIILLCGGDKSTQQADIEGAKKIARHYEGE